MQTRSASPTLASASGQCWPRPRGVRRSRPRGPPSAAGRRHVRSTRNGPQSAAQSEAVHTLSGPLLVLAGAGTGKTRVVTYRIAELIRHRTPPDRILAVTFTNKAADEMQQRAAALLGKRPERKPEISTFHSLCVRILRRHITHLGYPASFAIYDRGDQEGVARGVLREIKAAEGLLRPGDLLYFIGRWKTAGVGPEQAAALAQTDKEHLAAVGLPPLSERAEVGRGGRFRRLAAVRRGTLPPLAQGPRRRGRPLRPPAGRRIPGHQRQPIPHRQGPGGRPSQPLRRRRRRPVDLRLAGRRGGPHPRLPEGLARGQDRPPGNQLPLDPRDRRLGQSAHRLQPPPPRQGAPAPPWPASRRGCCNWQTKSRRPRPWWAKSPPASASTSASPAISPSSAAPTSSRGPSRWNSAGPRSLTSLIGGMSFYDRKEVRDLLAYLKVLANPRDEVPLLRIINTPPRGIGAATVKRLLEQAIGRGQAALGSAAEARTGGGGEISRPGRAIPPAVGKGAAGRGRPRPGRRDRLPRRIDPALPATPPSRKAAGRPSKRWSTPWPAMPGGRSSPRWPASCRTSRSDRQRAGAATRIRNSPATPWP